MRENIQELDRAINEVALKWYYTPEKSTAQKQKYGYELAELMFQYKDSGKPGKNSPNNTDEQFELAVNEFWASRLHKWDPEEQEFSKYFMHQMKYSKIDVHRQEYERHKMTVSDKQTGEKKVEWVHPVFLDSPLSEDSDISLRDTLADKTDEIGRILEDEDQTLDDTAIDFVRQIVSMSEKCGKRVTSPERKRYFSIRYTDIVSKFIREEQRSPCRKHEDEMLAQMRMPFLDYTSDRICRTVCEIASSQVKPYCQLVDGRTEDTTPPKQTFQADVYLAYIERIENCQVSRSSLSQHKTAFEDILDNWNKTRHNHD